MAPLPKWSQGDLRSILPHQVSDGFSLPEATAVEHVGEQGREAEFQHCPVLEYLYSWEVKEGSADREGFQSCGRSQEDVGRKN